jgi:hypothetical protein
MPNLTPEPVLYVAVNSLIGLRGPDERARLRFWVAAKFDVRGYRKPRSKIVVGRCRTTPSA